MNWQFQVYRQWTSPWVGTILTAVLVSSFLVQCIFNLPALFLLFFTLFFSLLFLLYLLIDLQVLTKKKSSPDFNLVKASATSKPDAEKPAGEAATFTTLTIINNNKTELIRFSEIIWLQSDKSVVEIQTTDKKYLLYRSLRSVEQELDTQQFVRIHRSAIVNRLFIESICQLPGGDGYLTLTTGEEIRYSRSYKKELMEK